MEDQILVDTGKMIKLNNIIKEIKVNKPFFLNKKQLLDWWFNKGNIYLLSYLTHSSSVEELLSNNGYDNLEDYLSDDFGFEEKDITEFIPYIEGYYRIFNPNEINISIFGNGYGTNIKGTSYKNMEIEYIGDREYYLYCNNF